MVYEFDDIDSEDLKIRPLKQEIIVEKHQAKAMDFHKSLIKLGFKQNREGDYIKYDKKDDSLKKVTLNKNSFKIENKEHKGKWTKVDGGYYKDYTIAHSSGAKHIVKIEEGPYSIKKKSSPYSFHKSNWIIYKSDKSEPPTIISFENPRDAKQSAKELRKEFNNAKRKDKKRKVATITQDCANESATILKGKDLSNKEKKEFKQIHSIYSAEAKSIWAEYNKEYAKK